jgi:hypothetical protein
MKAMNPVKKISPRHSPNPGLFSLVSLVLLVFGACSQDPIFYGISQEVELRDPQIKGAPTNIVAFDSTVFGKSVYVANLTTLYRYGKSGSDPAPVWGSVPQPGGDIKGVAALAVTRENLFVLTTSGLKKLGKNANAWESLTITYDDKAEPYANLQSIYADASGERLFVTGWSGPPSEDSGDYAILYLDENTNTLKTLETGVHALTGLVYDGDNRRYFMSTAGSGIFRVSEDSLSGSPDTQSVDNESSAIISAMIKLDDKTIVAVCRDGDLTAFDPAGSKFKTKHDVTDKLTSTTLALWRQPGPPSPSQLLLVGIQGSTYSQTYSNGYREIPLEDGKLPADVTSNEPGNSPIPSVLNPERYNSSLGKLPVIHLLQVPYEIDEKMPVFASTQKDGLYSYRDHGDGDEYWNAE